MTKKTKTDLSRQTDVFQQGRYVSVAVAATRIGLPEKTIWRWREKCAFDVDMAGLFAKVGKFVFFDLDAWARHLGKTQQDATEAAKAWQQRFRIVAFFQAAAAAAIVAALLQGGAGHIGG